VLRALKKHTHSEVSISNFDSEHWTRMSLAAGLTRRVHPGLELDDSSCKETPPFEWRDEAEPQQADRYARAASEVG
jgi:hypothetical protein